MTDLHTIIERNARVEADKAWETSWTRRLCIAGLTYVFMNIWLPILGVENAWMHASVPVCGYLFSTLGLECIKNKWTSKRSMT